MKAQRSSPRHPTSVVGLAAAKVNLMDGRQGIQSRVPAQGALQSRPWGH
jgi:hypothetical protein